MFTYFVCYNAYQKINFNGDVNIIPVHNLNLAWGNCDITFNHKIDCFDDIKEIIRQIELKENVSNVTIVNYTLLSVL
jgi:hypothetical protein